MSQFPGIPGDRPTYNIEKMADMLMDHDDKLREYEQFLKEQYQWPKQPWSARASAWIRRLFE